MIPVFFLQQAVATQKLSLHDRGPGIVHMEGYKLQPVCHNVADLCTEEDRSRYKKDSSGCGGPNCWAQPRRDRRLSDARYQLCRSYWPTLALTACRSRFRRSTVRLQESHSAKCASACTVASGDNSPSTYRSNITAWTSREIVWLLLVAGVVALLVKAMPTKAQAVVVNPALWLFAPPTVAGDSSLLGIFLYFAKAGMFVCRSGLAVVPFLYGGVVEEHHWLTDRQFVDAVAVAMITPGPVVITVASLAILWPAPQAQCLQRWGFSSRSI